LNICFQIGFKGFSESRQGSLSFWWFLKHTLGLWICLYSSITMIGTMLQFKQFSMDI